MPAPLAALLLTASLTVASPVTGSAVDTEVDPARVTSTSASMLNLPVEWTGAGVKVAVIDSGIAVENGNARLRTSPCFNDEAYTPADQVGDPTYTNNKVPVARWYGTPAMQIYPGGPVYGWRDAEALNLHGSHVAGIIACNDGVIAQWGGRSYPLRGIAPQALLGSYNVFPGLAVDGVGPGDEDIAKAISDAQADGMDVANLSLSIGRARAPRTNQAIKDAWVKGMISVVAAGNDGPKAETVGSPGNNPEAITVGALETGWGNRALVRIGERAYTGDVDGRITVAHPVEGAFTLLPQTRTDKLDWKRADKQARMPNPLRLSTGCSVGSVKAARGRIAVMARGVCPFTQKIANAAKAGARGALIVNVNDESITPADTGGRKVPAMLIPLSAGRALAADPGTTITLVPPTVVDTGTGGRVAWFSSQGPTTNGLSKPDVLAPGGGVLSAAAGEECASEAVCFAMESGTSMAAPAVAGVVALVKQAHPAWAAAMVRSAVIHTARQEPGVPVWVQGSGVVDAGAAVGARLGLDVTGVALRDGVPSVVRVLNPTDAEQTVSVHVSAAPGKSLRGTYQVPPTLVVPAGGSAELGVAVSGSRVGDNAMLELEGADGTRIHAVVSTIR